MRRVSVAVGLVIAAFGPYVGSELGLRTEQLFLYLAAVVACVSILHGWTIQRPALQLSLAWALILAVACVSAAFPVAGITGGSALAGADNLLGPLAALLIFAAWARDESGLDDIVYAIQRATIVLLCANALVAVASTAFDLSSFLSAYWAPGEGVTTAERAARMGRFSGVFNSPLAAGIANSLGLILAVHVYVTGKWRSGQVAMAASLIAVAGLLSVSKVFIIGGLPLAFVLLALAKRRRRSWSIAGAGLIAMLAAYALTASTRWSQGEERLTRLVTGDSDSLIDLYTAGRLGPDSTLQGTVRVVLENSPLVGAGLAPNVGPLDNSWVEIFAYAGLLGVAAFAAFLYLATAFWIRSRATMERTAWLTTGSLLALTLGATLGGPVITMNRSGTLLLLNALPYLIGAAGRSAHSGAVGRPPGPGRTAGYRSSAGG